MTIRNCSKCGKIFNYVAGKPICQNCRASLEEKFKETKIYIKRNPSSTVAEVSEECSVDIKQIKQWVREERLCFTEAASAGIDCEVCGKSINTGRFCDGCKGTMTRKLTSAYVKREELKVNPFAKDKSAKMHFLDDKKRR